ncbi:MAG: hypothetical protein WD034_01745 [Parvibaculum sp.]|uniref:hypothetical protein n=1 Tax=Parvibaculum sp. TaxID=2024848 RepID=UPI0034A058EE
MTARAFIQKGYILVAGRVPPLPLERPLFLAQTGLHDCLRGITPVESDDAYAAFCADLATFAGPAVVAASAPALRPMEAPARPEREAREEEIALAPAPEPLPEPLCLVDATGIVSTRIDGTWIKSAPKRDEGSAPDTESSRIVVVPPRCAVQSPANAEVLYAGNFKGYLGIVILDTGRVERLTVAGLGMIEVRRGDRIARGATIGWTSQRAAPALAEAAASGDAALLYIEGTPATGPAG